MPLGQGKTTVAATITSELREKIKQVAAIKHWSVAQTLGLFIDRYWDDWVKELGINEKPSPSKESKRPGRKKTES